MRKLIAAVAILGLMGNGCAWLGFSDEEEVETAAATTKEPEASQEATKSEPEAKAATPAKARQETKKPEAKNTKARKGAKSEAQIKAELDKMGRKLAAQSARTLLPNKANKEVRKAGKEWVASYVSVDAENVSTEMKPGANGQYVGFIRYQEHFFECRGATKQAALSAPCAETRSRRLTELIRYDGRQWQD